MPRRLRIFVLFSAAMALALAPLDGFAQAYTPRRAEAVAPAAVPAASEGNDGRPATIVDPDRKLQQGDQLSFSIEEDRDPAAVLQVSASGDLRIENLCSVHVAGSTVEDAARAIKRRLEADYYYTATVHLALERVNPNFSLGFVYLSGEINKVGSVPIYADRPMMLSQAVLNAGGLGRFANGHKVQITRTGKNGAAETFTRDVDLILKKSRVDLDMLLQDGDRIYVPRAGLVF